MYARLLTPQKLSFFLLGMRGTGKSSWVREHYSDAKRIDLLVESDYQRYLVNPDLFAEQLRAVPQGSWVVVDEVQRLPQLLNEVHRAIEERKLKFALLGSSARKLRKSGVNLLGGRALLRTMYPFLPQELGEDFSLEHALRFGTLPLVMASEAPAQQLEAYVQLYLKEEIQAEALVRNLPGFARFLPVAALFHGQTLNVTGLARDAGVSRSTVEGYLGILEDTFLGFRLPGFEPRLRVKERTTPKWYWIDNGVARAARGSFHVPTSEERGALFEAFIALVLRGLHDYGKLPYDNLSYWSPPGGATEVDFIIERGDERVAIEVKSHPEPGDPHLKGLRSLVDLKGLRRRILVYPGSTTRVTKDGIEILGLKDFLENVEDGLSRQALP